MLMVLYSKLKIVFSMIYCFLNFQKEISLVHSCSASFCLNSISQKILWKKWAFKSFKEGNCSFIVTVWNTCAAAQSCQIFVTAWTVAHQDPLFIAFSRQEYWSVPPFPTPACLPHPGIKPVSLACPALADGLFNPGTNQEAQNEKLSPKEGK